MPWNDCLYAYHKARGGQLLAGEEDSALLILTWKDQPLVAGLSNVSAGRGGTACYVQARIPVTLPKPYRLTIGAEKTLSGGVNTVLKAVPGLPDSSLLPGDFGFPEVTKKRLIRSDRHDFTKLVLGSLELRNALLACPAEKLEVCPGPGEEGLHLITVVTASALSRYSDGGGDWYLGDTYTFHTQEERDQLARQLEETFFPRMDRFLDLARTAYNAVTQWPM